MFPPNPNKRNKSQEQGSLFKAIGGEHLEYIIIGKIFVHWSAKFSLLLFYS